MKNTFIVILAVSMVSAIGGVPFNTMPLLSGSLGESLSLDGKQIGLISSVAFFGYLIGTLSGPFWVNRVNWRTTSLCVSMLAALSFVMAANASGTMLIVSFVGFGFFCSLMHALCMRILADMPDPERAFGTRLSVELIIISVALLLLPATLMIKFGFAGAAYGLAALILIMGLGAFFMPKRENSLAQDAIAFPSWSQARAGWICLGLFLVYCLANVGLWIFLYTMAAGFSPTGQQTGLMFGMLKVLGASAGFIGAIIGARAGLRLPNVVCLVFITLGVIGLYLSNNFTQFMISSWVWEFGFTLGCLYQTAAIARFDPTNKLIVLVPTAFAISSMVGAALSGFLTTGGNYLPLLMFVVFCSLLPAAYMFLARPHPPVTVEV